MRWDRWSSWENNPWLKTLQKHFTDLMKNLIFEYWKQIESGAVVVSDKVRRVYKKLVADKNGKSI